MSEKNNLFDAISPPAALSRERIRALVQTAAWERIITVLIVINAVTMGIETSSGVMAQYGGLIRAIDTIVLTIFVIEIALRIYAHGWRFWQDGWNLFDFAVVAIALMPSTGNFSVLRSLRIIRALRLISAVPSMRRVVNGLFQAIPGMGAIIMLMLLIFYVFSVMATKLYGNAAPELFGTLGRSAFSLFQVMTLEGWAEIAEEVMKTHPGAIVFFVAYILITSFAILNLFIGIIVDSMQKEQEDLLREDRVREEAEFKELLTEVRALKEEMVSVRQSLNKTKRG